MDVTKTREVVRDKTQIPVRINEALQYRMAFALIEDLYVSGEITKEEFRNVKKIKKSVEFKDV